MKLNLLRLFMGTLLAFPLFASFADAQSKPKTTDQSSDDRIAELEERIKVLEQVVFATSKLTVYDAERNLILAKRKLKNSKKLFLKGFITDVQIAQDEFDVERAIREVDLASATSGTRRISMEIDLLQAEFNLSQALSRLEYTRQSASRGFSSKIEIDDDQKRVTRAEKHLTIARSRLAALSKQEPPSKQAESSSQDNQTEK